MADKSLIIILNSFKYKEYNIVIHGYSQRWGKQSYIVSIPKGSKKRILLSQLHPLSVIECEVESLNKRKEIRKISNFSTLYNLTTIRSDIRKSAIAMFMGEFVNRLITEEEQHDELFKFILESTLLLEDKVDHFSNLHTAFVVHICKLIGYAPLNNYDNESCLFDITSAKFVRESDVSDNHFTAENSAILHALIHSENQYGDLIQLSGKQRHSLLKEIITYIRYHTGQKIDTRSIDILHEVFEL